MIWYSRATKPTHLARREPGLSLVTAQVVFRLEKDPQMVGFPHPLSQICFCAMLIYDLLHCGPYDLLSSYSVIEIKQ